MKREEVRKLIEGITDDQLDGIMRLHGSDIEAKNREVGGLQAKLDAANAELDGFRASQSERQSESERIQAALDDLAAQKREMAVKSNRIDARAILKGIGLPDEAVEAQLDRIVTEDGEASSVSAQALADLITAQREEAAAAKERELLKGMSGPKGSAAQGEPTQKDFKAMTYAEKFALKSENPDLYAQLSKE